MVRTTSIEAYLARLYVALERQFPDDDELVRRIVAEAEDHLREAAERNRPGSSPDAAERDAIRQFGSPQRVAQRFARELKGRLSPLGLLVRSYLYVGMYVGSVLVAAGAALLIVGVFGALFGAAEVFGLDDPPAVSGTKASCEQWPTYYQPDQPGTNTVIDCEIFAAALAASFSQFSESLFQTWSLLLGGGGIVVGAVIWALHRGLLRWHAGVWDDLSGPARVYVIFGALSFGMAAVSFLQGIPSSGGTSLYWTGAAALVAALFCVAYAREGWRMWVAR